MAIATACFLLVTGLPLLDLSEPSLYSPMTFLTFLSAFVGFLAIEITPSEASSQLQRTATTLRPTACNAGTAYDLDRTASAATIPIGIGRTVTSSPSKCKRQKGQQTELLTFDIAHGLFHAFIGSDHIAPSQDR